MLNSRMRRAAAVITTFVACGVLAACSGTSEETEGAKDSVSTTIGTRSVDTADVADNITVVFQMTGLLLAVPPKQAGSPMQVILPEVGAETHYARLGFGGDSSRVCAKYDQGICYVDLAQWSLQPVGGEGTPVDLHNTQFPRGVLNVTRGSGGVHTVNTPGNANNIVTHVDFLSGRARQDACRMARWRYKPHGKTEDTVSLVNVMYWDIQQPRNQPFTLTFSPKPPNTGSDTTIHLITSDSVFVVLAHVPQTDLDEMPPKTATPSTEPLPASLV
ncbi:MAG TPA: hypothetical protein VFY65_08915, partial [Longimicrobium sp.]|nr:hypothetical protein [Longimicrobium sp.]